MRVVGQRLAEEAMALLVYLTMPDEDAALALARMLVHERLAAGVNIVPGARSIYRWRDDVHEAAECLLLAQVAEAAFDDFSSAVRRVHTYEVPCIIALPLTAGHAPFLQWIEENSRPSS